MTTRGRCHITALEASHTQGGDQHKGVNRRWDPRELCQKLPATKPYTEQVSRGSVGTCLAFLCWLTGRFLPAVVTTSPTVLGLASTQTYWCVQIALISIDSLVLTFPEVLREQVFVF